MEEEGWHGSLNKCCCYPRLAITLCLKKKSCQPHDRIARSHAVCLLSRRSLLTKIYREYFLRRQTGGANSTPHHTCNMEPLAFFFSNPRFVCKLQEKTNSQQQLLLKLTLDWWCQQGERVGVL